MTIAVYEDALNRGIEVDIGAVHATPEGYGRLTIREHEGQFELYDLDNETVILHNDELEPLVEQANELSQMEFEYSGVSKMG